ncbi:hypothetical protein Tsp_05606 [Trichinella spiralis]|uniref:hypothetical protein n=1 Tax=Trichinella spiralis TaxID=6334 RepID=UPI0001EFE197|nr:hypothetical protein Tsp_05606 [Trichinella spiralis]
MLRNQINSPFMSNYWAHTWYLFQFLEYRIPVSTEELIPCLSKTAAYCKIILCLQQVILRQLKECENIHSTVVTINETIPYFFSHMSRNTQPGDVRTSLQ